jgi:hypothetical protein
VFFAGALGHADRRRYVGYGAMPVVSAAVSSFCSAAAMWAGE